jgi:hypothetical protein
LQQHITVVVGVGGDSRAERSYNSACMGKEGSFGAPSSLLVYHRLHCIALATTTSSVRTTRPLHPASRPLHARTGIHPSLVKLLDLHKTTQIVGFCATSHTKQFGEERLVLVCSYCNCNYVLYGLWFGMTSSLSLLCMTF